MQKNYCPVVTTSPARNAENIDTFPQEELMMPPIRRIYSRLFVLFGANR
jgi:hypothetical protein